jgi:ankyrin repeat protein
LFATQSLLTLIFLERIDAMDHNGQTPLHLACSVGHFEAVDVLLNNGATVNVADKFGQTPLHIAAAKGRVHVVRLLLQR